MTKLEPPSLDRDWVSFMVRLGQCPEWHQLRKHLQAESDDLKADELAKAMGRRFREEIANGIVEP